MGVYKKNYFHFIEEIIGWDEVLEKEYVLKKFRPGLDKIIMLNEMNAGYLSIDFFDDFVEIKHIVLLPRFQRKGIGTAIISKIQTENKGIPLMVVVDKHDTNSLHFYTKLGFKITNEFPFEKLGRVEKVQFMKIRMVLPS